MKQKTQQRLLSNGKNYKFLLKLKLITWVNKQLLSEDNYAAKLVLTGSPGIRQHNGLCKKIQILTKRFCGAIRQQAKVWVVRNASSPGAQIPTKLSRGEEADSIMKKMLPLANMQEVHLYGRSLLAQKKTKDAFDAFKMNYDKHPNVFTTNMGMARAYSGVGNYKKALEFAQKAQTQVPNPVNKANLEKMIKLLQDGKDVN